MSTLQNQTVTQRIYKDSKDFMIKRERDVAQSIGCPPLKQSVVHNWCIKGCDEVCSIMRLSAPLKKQYAVEHDLDFNKLLDASEYKERYRHDMILWGEEKRNADPGFFCQLSTSGTEANKPVWIISDARRKTDIGYFKEVYPKATRTVRVVADEEIRKKRGYVFTTGVDDAESECGLDVGVDWDYIITNNDDSELLNNNITRVTDFIKSKLHVPS